MSLGADEVSLIKKMLEEDERKSHGHFEICKPNYAIWGHVQVGVLVKENLLAELLLCQLAPWPDTPCASLGQTTPCSTLPWL